MTREEALERAIAALWLMHDGDKRTPIADAIEAAYKEGLAARGENVQEGIPVLVIMRVGFGGEPEEPSLWRTRLWYPNEREQAETLAACAYYENVEVRSARLILSPATGGING